MTAAATSKAASSPPPTCAASTAGNGKRVRDHAEDAPESQAPPTKKVYDMFAPKKDSNVDITAPPVASTSSSSQVPSAVAPGDASVLLKKRQCSPSLPGIRTTASRNSIADRNLPVYRETPANPATCHPMCQPNPYRTPTDKFKWLATNDRILLHGLYGPPVFSSKLACFDIEYAGPTRSPCPLRKS